MRESIDGDTDDNEGFLTDDPPSLGAPMLFPATPTTDLFSSFPYSFECGLKDCRPGSGDLDETKDTGDFIIVSF